MSRKTHSSLYELIAAQLVQASRIFANTLIFDRAFAQFLHFAPVPKSDEDPSLDAIQSFKDLQAQVEKRLLGRSRALLDAAGHLELIEFAQRRAAIHVDFARLMTRAGVLHDHILSTASMAPPDMTRAWRRLEVTDQHARATVTRIAINVADALTKLVGQKRRPVIIDYRHFHEGRNVTLDDKNTYLTIPFWAIYMPRTGAGIVAHECAHSIVEDLLRAEAQPTESWTAFQDTVADVLLTVRAWAYPAPLEELSTQQRYLIERSADDIMCELLSDVLAAMILGPAYIINIAEHLIGTYPVEAERLPRVDRVPHSVRVQVLLKLYDAGLFAWAGAEPSFLLGQVHASVHEYHRTNKSIGTKQRRDWIEFQANLLEFVVPGLDDLIRRRLLNDESSNPEVSSPWATIREARRAPAVATYAKVWQQVNDRAEKLADDGGTPTDLLRALETLTEVRSFIRANHDALAATPPAALTLETGESWSLDWFWLRARPPEDREGPDDDPPLFEDLGLWMRDFAPPSPRPEQEICGIYGLVLGASDGFVLRPFLRVRQEAGINPDDRQGLAAYVERRALIEINAVIENGRTLWTPGPWSESCFITELLVAQDDTREAFLRAILDAREQTGLRLTRAWIGTGWASLVLIFQPEKSNWRSPHHFFGAAVSSPARSVTSIICSLAVTGANWDGTLDSPWVGCGDRSSMIVQSSLRVRQAQNIFALARDWPGEPPANEQGHARPTSRVTISPTFGPHDGVATFSLDDPGNLPHVVSWLYREIAQGRLTRSVTTILAEELQ